MIVYGIHPVQEALRWKSDRVSRLLIARGKRNTRLDGIVELARGQGVPVRFEPVEALTRQAASERHQGAVAVLAQVRFLDLGELIDKKPSLVLLPDGVEDPRNLGALLRTAEAAGVDGVLLPQRRSAGLTPIVVKSSAGAALHLPIVQIGNVSQTLRRFKDLGLWTLGLDMNGTHSVTEIDPTLPFVVIVGGEDRGVRPAVRKQCDFLVSLPLRGKVDSLNLSVAAGIVLYRIALGREASSG